MASAMEKMVAGMLGITPEEMAAMMTGFQDLLKNLAATLAEIKEQGQANHALLLEMKERLDNVGSNDSGKLPGRRTGSNRNSNGSANDGSGGSIND